MNFEKFKTLNDQKENYRVIDNPSVVSNYRNSGCGDGYRIFLKIENENIIDASYLTTGCGFSIAALEAMISAIKNSSLEEAKKLSVEKIESFFLFPERRKNYPLSALQALQKAIKDYEEKKENIQQIKKNEFNEDRYEDSNFNNQNLESLNLKNKSFKNSSFINVFMLHGNFENCDFSDCYFKGAFLNNSIFINCDFKNANFQFAKMTGVKFLNCQFDNAVYDATTRVSSNNIHIFEKMKMIGKKYFKNNS